MDKEVIFTDIDKLISLIKEKKRVELNEVAHILGVSASTVEEWASFLEKEGIISLDYSLSDVFLVWKEPSQEEVKRREEEELKRELAKASDILRKIPAERIVKHVREMRERY